MAQIHGKKFSLQQITVKVPGQHMPVVRTGSFPAQNTINIEHISGMGSQGDSFESSLMSVESSLVRANPAANGADMEMTINVVPPASPSRNSHEPRSPLSDEGDSDHDSPQKDGYQKSNTKRLFGDQFDLPLPGGHQRNSSMDEMLILKQLRTQGSVYVPPGMTEERERSMTLLRAQLQQKVRLRKGGSKRPKLGPIFHSEEDLSDSMKVESSQESLVKPEKKGKKDRNSMVIGSEDGKDVRRTPSKHRRQRSIGGGKMEVTEGGQYGDGLHVFGCTCT